MAAIAGRLENDAPDPRPGAGGVDAPRQVAPIPAQPVEVAVDAGAASAVALAPEPFTCKTGEEGLDRSRLGAIVELGKPRISRLVAITAMGGLAMSMVGRGFGTTAAWTPLILSGAACAMGTWLSSAGANGLNQALESEFDALMHRTRRRPVPTGRLTRAGAMWASFGMLGAGLALLYPFCGPAATLVSFLTAALYVLIYTPLKRRTILNTWVGTIPGALPPLIGWCAAAYASSPAAGWSALWEPGGWSLFALMAVWQIPHFLALAWLHRDDYRRGLMRMLPVVDPTGRATMAQIVIWSALLIPATLLPWLVMPERVGLGYAVVALVTGVWYFGESIALLRDRSQTRARRVFLISVTHLPVLMLALAVSVAWSAWRG